MKNDKIHSYTVIFQPAEEGGFMASIPELPGCLSQGETLEEARLNIRDAIQGYLSVLKEDGDELPREFRAPIIEKISTPDPA